MKHFTKSLLAGAFLFASMGPSAADPCGWHNPTPGHSIENQMYKSYGAPSFQVQSFSNPKTGRNYTAVIQQGRNHGAGVSQRGNANKVRVVQRGKNTKVIVKQRGNNNVSNVMVLGIR